ncbi:MAG: hypothetical protein AAFV29_06925, partial [Myxococcota bacterium]
LTVPPGMASAQNKSSAPVMEEIPGMGRPGMPPLKRWRQDFSPNQASGHRRYRAQQRKMRNVEPGKPFDKIVRVEEVEDGIVKVSMPMRRSFRRSKKALYGYFRIGRGVSSRQLRGLVGQQVNMQLQSDGYGQLVIRKFGSVGQK